MMRAAQPTLCFSLPIGPRPARSIARGYKRHENESVWFRMRDCECSLRWLMVRVCITSIKWFSLSHITIMKNEIQSCMYIWAVRDPNTWCAVNTFGILTWQVFFQAYNLLNHVLMCLRWLPKEKRRPQRGISDAILVLHCVSIITSKGRKKA